MALAMHWCVSAGYEEALNNPTPAEKKRSNRPILSTGVSAKLTVARCHGSNVAYAYC